MEHSAGGADYDVGRVEPLQHFNLVHDWFPPEDDFGLDILQKFGKSQEFFFNLVGQFSGVAQHEDADWLWLVQLVQDGEHEHCSLAHAALGLGEDVHPNHCVGDTLLLDFTWVLESALLDGPQQFGFQ